MTVWLEQAECTLLKHGNFLLGFCDGPVAETEGMITFFYPAREDVDALFPRMRECAATQPKENERYRIYHFFARDPEDRAVEFQAFLHPVAPHLDAREALTTRRSVRAFAPDPVPEDVLRDVFEACRFAPSNMHTEPVHYVVVRDAAVLRDFAAMRKGASAPLGCAPLAVAVCADPERSAAHRTDAAIAAYHFMLAAWAHGLGTCWIADMDRPAVKQALGVPKAWSVATVTPLGYPAERPDPRGRRTVEEMVRTVG